MGMLMVSMFVLDPMHTFDYGLLYDYLGFVWTGLLGGRSQAKQDMKENIKLYTECESSLPA